MARTPLLRSLVDLARLHRSSEKEGIPVDEVAARAARRPERTVSRRALLAAGAATAAASMVARPKLAFGAGAPRVAIVGGGISGLTAALTLADLGVASTVYESSGRVGGRMFSNPSYWDQAQVSEWCGELIDSSHQTVIALAQRFKLRLDDLLAAQPPGSEDTYFFCGRYYPRSKATNDFRPVYQALTKDANDAGYPTLYDQSTPAGRALDAMSVHEWIASRVPGGHSSHLGKLLDVAYAIEYGADTREQSALNLVYLLSSQNDPNDFGVFGVSNERFHIAGGNQQLPAAIAKHVTQSGGVVETGHRMLAIGKRADGTFALAFSTAGGTRDVVADYVILALPFAVLRNLNYAHAGFDARKDTAIQELGRAHNGKLQLQFKKRLWDGKGAWPGTGNGNSYSDAGYQNTWEVTRAQPGTGGILVDYTGGSVTDRMSTSVPFANASVAAVGSDARRFLAQIEQVYPGLTAEWNGKATSSLPQLDKNFQCSYSFWKRGQYTRFAGYEKVRQGNCFFAGEHTSVDYQGYMEGGASEGVRAANEILTALGKI